MLIFLGGTESHTFNRLEDIALDWKAKTPVLGCQISRVLVTSFSVLTFLPFNNIFFSSITLTVPNEMILVHVFNVVFAF